MERVLQYIFIFYSLKIVKNYRILYLFKLLINMKAAKTIDETNKFEPVEKTIIQGYVKKYIFSDEKMDFGKYLNNLEINPFDRILLQ